MVCPQASFLLVGLIFVTVSLDAIWQVFLHKWDQVSPYDMESIHNMFWAIQVKGKKDGKGH